MTDVDRLADRLDAVERALTDGDHPLADLEGAGRLADRLDALETRADDIEDRLAELDAGLQAVRGYVGNAAAVEAEVERRADAALAAVDRLEARLDDRPAEPDPALAADGHGWVDAGASGGFPGSRDRVDARPDHAFVRPDADDGPPPAAGRERVDTGPGGGEATCAETRDEPREGASDEAVAEQVARASDGDADRSLLDRLLEVS